MGDGWIDLDRTARSLSHVRLPGRSSVFETHEGSSTANQLDCFAADDVRTTFRASDVVVPPTCNSVFMGGRRELVASARLGIDLPNPGPAAHTAARRIRCRGLQTARKLELDSNRCLVPAWHSCRVHGLAVAEIVFCPGRTWIEPLSLRSASRRIEQVCRSRWTFRYSGLL